MGFDYFDMIDLWRRQAAFAGGVAAMAPFAGFVVATRLGRMAAEGGRPSVVGTREARRMVVEKFAAAYEGGIAAGEVLTGLAGAATPVAAAGIVVAAGEAALAPVSRTVRANAKRLSRAR